MCCEAVQKLFRSDVVGEVSLEVCARVADASISVDVRIHTTLHDTCTSMFQLLMTNDHIRKAGNMEMEIEKWDNLKS